jgi:hypothetical protein
LILGAGALAVCGIALSATGSEDVGKWLTLTGVILMIVGLHRFGRSGPDEPLEFDEGEPKRKKRKKRAKDAPDSAH